MSAREIILETTLRHQIMQIAERIEEMRLETIPDVEAIRILKMNLDGLRAQLEALQKDDDSLPVA